MSKKLKLHLLNRDQIFKQLERFQTFIVNFNLENDGIHSLTKRLEKADLLLNEFNKVQIEIEMLDDTDNEKRNEFEQLYYKLTSDAQVIIDKINSNENKSPGGLINIVQPLTSNNSYDNIKLPDFNLPSFNGNYGDYMEFHDTFNSLIHENINLSNSRKLHYLKSCVVGEAAKCIQNYKITDENYLIAWQTIKETFEHKRSIIEQHIKTLFDISPIFKSNSENLKNFTFTIVNQVGCLKSLGLEVEHWNPLLIHLLINKLDHNTKLAWEQLVETHDNNYLPTLDELIKFLRIRIQTIQKVFTQTQNNQNLNQKSDHKYFQNHYNKNTEKLKVNQKTSSHLSNSSKPKCPFCRDAHFIYACKKFLDLSNQDRFNEIKKRNLCTNCLRSNHAKQDCIAQSCKLCNKRHNTLLCFSNQTGESSSSNQETNLENNQSLTTTLNSNSYNPNHIILLSTAIVNIYDSKNQPIACRTLLDSGSQSNFMTTNLAKKLKLKTYKTNVSISGINKTTSNTYLSATAKIHSKFNNYSKELTFLILDNITSFQPSISFPIRFNIPKDINLADPLFNVSQNVDLLLGVSVFYELLCVGQIKLAKNQPILQKTQLGWIVSGEHEVKINSNNITSLLSINDISIKNQLQKFWEIEEIPNNPFTKYNQKDLFCLDHFEKTTVREDSGRIQVSLPLKENYLLLENNLTNAKNRFFSIERKLQKDLNLKLAYTKFMREYESLNHMTKLNEFEINNDNPKYYLPHHCVFKRLTTKIRVVFDGSSRGSNGLSLNDVCYVGPTIQDDLFSIILRYRKHNFVLKADIVKMYRQISVNPIQRQLQSIVWRENPNESLNHYKLNTVTYGTAPAAFLSIRSLQEIAHINKHKYPKACDIILSDFYVDDLCTGAETISELKNIKHDIESVLNTGCFELSQWMSNNSEVLNIQEQNCDLTYHISDSESIKTLRVYWNPGKDTFQFTINIDIPNKTLTKRIILSIVSQVFDPLGLISPIIIKCKFILQQLWKLNLKWDESVPVLIQTDFLTLLNNIKQLYQLEIPRHVLLKNPTKIQIHGFSDASELAYGCVIYLRSTDCFGNISINLLCSKSKVAPLKTISLPRLELCGALILSRLLNKVQQSLKLEINTIFLWTDSQIVLAWLSHEPSHWKTFIANRVSEIQLNTKDSNWRHVNSENNPADLITRGCETSKLIHNELWWHGPKFLLEHDQYWPKASIDFLNIPAPEIKVQKISINLSFCDSSIFEKFSSYTKLIKVVAYCLRFANNCKTARHQRSTGSLNVTEYDFANQCLIKLTQGITFFEEIKDLLNKKQVSKTSKIANLNPFLDEVNIIRVGGRLSNSELDFHKKFPIVLPSKHPYTKLLINYEHIKTYHGGVQTTLFSIRQNYWPLNAKNEIKNTIRNCLTCFKTKPKEINQIMGNLPKSRITPTLPFSSCGVDFAGPFLVKESTLRNSKFIKFYICLFICFTTKAVHIEPAGDLSSETFLNALKRFIARRGIPKNIYSDNGTNFVGANNILKRELNMLVKLSKDHVVTNFLLENKIVWHFIPPRAPNFGGLWESAIKLAKRHLIRIVGDAKISFENFLTIITQIESILNSRPLSPLTNDPNDLQALTPGHFLIGKPLNMLPENNISSVSINRLNHYQRILQLMQHFWSRWTSEYLNSLQVRNKWKFKTQQEPKINDMIIIKEDNLPPLKWKLGRIDQVHPGPDGLIRVVTVKTNDGLIKRSINKICKLPNQ